MKIIRKCRNIAKIMKNFFRTSCKLRPKPVPTPCHVGVVPFSDCFHWILVGRNQTGKPKLASHFLWPELAKLLQRQAGPGFARDEAWKQADDGGNWDLVRPQFGHKELQVNFNIFICNFPPFVCELQFCTFSPWNCNFALFRS